MVNLKSIDINKLIPYALNSRTHTEDQVSKVAASIKEFGFLNPVIVDSENGIIAGHCRVQAAKILGIEKIPCIEAKHLTDAQKKAYVIADNRLALDAEWDNELLKIELSALESIDFDVSLTGFTDKEMLALLGDGLDKAEKPISDQEYSETFEVVVSCRDQAEQEAIYQMMTGKGLKCRVLSM